MSNCCSSNYKLCSMGCGGDTGLFFVRCGCIETKVGLSGCFERKVVQIVAIAFGVVHSYPYGPYLGWPFIGGPFLSSNTFCRTPCFLIRTFYLRRLFRYRIRTPTPMIPQINEGVSTFFLRIQITPFTIRKRPILRKRSTRSKITVRIVTGRFFTRLQHNHYQYNAMIPRRNIMMALHLLRIFFPPTTRNERIIHKSNTSQAM